MIGEGQTINQGRTLNGLRLFRLCLVPCSNRVGQKGFQTEIWVG